MLSALSSEVREMIVLRYMLGWQVRQIARYLGVNENTISVTIRRALGNLERQRTCPAPALDPGWYLVRAGQVRRRGTHRISRPGRYDRTGGESALTRKI